MKILRTTLLLLFAGMAWGQYPYYVNDDFVADCSIYYACFNSNIWVARAGAPYPTIFRYGLASSGDPLIAMPRQIPPGGFGADHELTMNVQAYNGHFSLYARMSDDLASYYALVLYNGTATINRALSGSVTQLASFPYNKYIAIQARLVVHGNMIIAYAGSAEPSVFYDDSISSGMPAFGIQDGVARGVAIGPVDTSVPSAVDPTSVKALTLESGVTLRWAASADGPNGIGIASYAVYREGVYLGLSTSTQYTDETAPPGADAHYTIRARDWHLNESVEAAKTVAVPPYGSTTPVRTGLRPDGAYWGAAGEQIDVLSGNLNFSIPLLKAVGRGGWTVPFALSYNSQIWLQNSESCGGQNCFWRLGSDVGYGLGWRLQAGSIAPVWYGSTLHHFIFTNSTGAEYRLDQNSGGVWSSTDSIYVWYDVNTHLLHFPDGSFWNMSVQSASSEPDAGTLYPSLIQDSNGNQIMFRYAGGIGLGYNAVDTSSRILSIVDPRSLEGRTYTFVYSVEDRPHLTAITNEIGTAEKYTISYAANQNLSDPAGSGVPFGSTTLLQSVGVTGLGVSNEFTYGTAAGGTTGELTSVTTPLGGTLSWAYRTFTYSGLGLSLREVQDRQMTATGGGTQYSWALNLDDSATTQHAFAVVADNGANTSKKWYFNGPSPAFSAGAPSAYEETDGAGNVLLRKEFGWAQGPVGNLYQNSLITRLDYGKPYEAASKTTQVLDAYGNVTETAQYDYGNLNTPARRYAYTYLTGENYIPRYIRNRLVSATLTAGNASTLLTSNTYDGSPWTGFYLQDQPDLPYHDPAYDYTFYYRGNLRTKSGLDTLRCDQIYISGIPQSCSNGVTYQYITPDASTAYSLPATLSPGGSLDTNFTYAPSFAVTSVSDANGAASTTTYDSYGRPLTTTTPARLQTQYTYHYNPNWQQGTQYRYPLPDVPWSRTTQDGFGRTIRVEQGTDGNLTTPTIVSTVDTIYGPCACSPLGKLQKVSNPYAPGETPVWTEYAYDASGRTVSVTAPDGSVTRYSYQGTTTTVTDPAGKWKAFTTDAFGNLVLVTEPNPAGGGNLTTVYTYTPLNQLASVTMPRSEGPQTRTFTWSGKDMITATNPENGTVTYAYDVAHRVTTRADAKGQQTRYTYDGYNRLAARQYYLPDGQGGFIEQTGEAVQYTYDTAYNGLGKLATVAFGAGGGRFKYSYSYDGASGQVASRDLTIITRPSGMSSSPSVGDSYGYDAKGRPFYSGFGGAWGGYPTRVSYQYRNSYDTMGRLAGMDQYDQDNYVWFNLATATYNTAGQMASLWTTWTGTETRTYNSLLQLTRTSIPGVMDMEYTYAAGQNNGRITQSKDWIGGEEVTYAYDSLQRLISAETTGPEWGAAYSYDGFGNLTGKTVTKGTAPALSIVYDPATNRPVGSNYDANGNAPIGVWDIENRLVSQTLDGQAITWGYDPSNQRFLKYAVVNGQPTWVFYLRNIAGQQVAELTCNSGGASCTFTRVNAYFGDKLIASTDASGRVLGATDRLGSVRAAKNGGTWTQMSYYPYGEPKTPGGVDGAQQFATYTRDSTASAQDYADQRYYSNVMGRFYGPDPIGRMAANPRDPQSWNSYAYAATDPVNLSDPSGLCFAPFSDVWGFSPAGGGGGGYPGRCVSVQRGGHGGGGLGCLWDVFGTEFAPVPNSACYVNEPEPTAEPALPLHIELRVSKDCYVQNPGVPGVLRRDVTYEAWAVYSDETTAYKITGNAPGSIIAEQHIYAPGYTGYRPPVSRSLPHQPFFDQYSVGINRFFKETQTFSLTLASGTYSAVPIMDRNGHLWSANDVTGTNGYIEINGDRNLRPDGTPSMCP